MNNMTVVCKNESEMENLGRKFAEQLSGPAVVSLRGSLGAGKTVFARGVARGLGITEAVLSPTFTLIQEYRGRLPLVHMDLYRIKSIEDFQMTGGEEYLFSDAVCLIEWSEVIDEILPEQTVFINITINEDSSRTVEIKSL